jgi:hypothetical protein
MNKEIASQQRNEKYWEEYWACELAAEAEEEQAALALRVPFPIENKSNIKISDEEIRELVDNYACPNFLKKTNKIMVRCSGIICLFVKDDLLPLGTPVKKLGFKNGLWDKVWALEC